MFDPRPAVFTDQWQPLQMCIRDRDQQDGLFPALIPHGLEDDPFVQAVQIGGRLVQQEKGLSLIHI